MAQALWRSILEQCEKRRVTGGATFTALAAGCERRAVATLPSSSSLAPLAVSLHPLGHGQPLFGLPNASAALASLFRQTAKSVREDGRETGCAAPGGIGRNRAEAAGRKQGCARACWRGAGTHGGASEEPELTSVSLLCGRICRAGGGAVIAGTRPVQTFAAPQPAGRAVVFTHGGKIFEHQIGGSA